MTDAPPPTYEPPRLSKSLRTAHECFNAAQTVFIEVKDGQPVDPDWPSLTVQQPRATKPQWDIVFYDDAVVLGAKSNNLAAIRFNDQKDRDDFLAKNPRLKDTLRSMSPEGFYVWIRVQGWVPGNYRFPKGELMSEGAFVLINKNGGSPKYQLDDQKHPVTIGIEGIIWPPELAKCLAIKKIGLDYPIVITDIKGCGILNDDYMVAMLMLQNPDVYYNPVSGWFYRLQEGDGEAQPQRIYEEEIKNAFHRILRGLRKPASKAPLDELPAPLCEAFGQTSEPASKAEVYVDTSLKHLASLVELLKVMAVKPFVVKETTKPLQEAAPKPPINETEEAKNLDEFITTQLEQAEGANLTVSEALAGYDRYCSCEGLLRFSPRQFHDRLTDAVKRSFGVQKTHDVIRSGQAKRGFRNLRLKRQGVEPGIEAFRTDRTDRTALFEGMERCQTDLTAYLATAT